MSRTHLKTRPWFATHNRLKMRSKFFVVFFTIFLGLSSRIDASTTLPSRNPFSPVPIQKQTELIPTTLQSCWIPLYFSKAENIMSFLSKKSLRALSDEGQINYDQRSNQIWVRDDKPHIALIHSIIRHLDQPGSQFQIKAKIINLDRDYQKALGFLFQTENNTKSSLMGLTMDQPSGNQNAGEFTLSIAKLAGDHLLDMQISALEQEGHASLISNPSLTTLNNQAAVIESGSEVPYQETTFGGGTGVRFKKAVLRLKVTPQEMPNHHILLHIELNQDKVSALTVKGVPAIQTQKITTQVVVADNQTIVLGGILETAHAQQTEEIPVIGDVPVVGKLFQHHTQLVSKRELLIFITPHMMKLTL